MKAYIQTNKKGIFYNVNAFVAYEGFEKLGWETHFYVDVDEIEDQDPEMLIVGGIGNVRKRLRNLGYHSNHQEIDYPPTLEGYLGRNVWKDTLDSVFRDKMKRNIFIKPREETKRFVGKVVKEDKDFIDLMSEKDILLWCSEIVEFQTEWRCFMRYKQLLDIRRYKGKWNSRLDISVVESAINDFKNQPASYVLDFGIDEKSKTLLVEANDGHSVGAYGMGSINYAKFLSARWAEMTNTKDYANF